jgi:hypothetical protein
MSLASIFRQGVWILFATVVISWKLVFQICVITCVFLKQVVQVIFQEIVPLLRQQHLKSYLIIVQQKCSKILNHSYVHTFSTYSTPILNVIYQWIQVLHKYYLLVINSHDATTLLYEHISEGSRLAWKIILDIIERIYLSPIMIFIFGTHSESAFYIVLSITGFAFLYILRNYLVQATKITLMALFLPSRLACVGCLHIVRTLLNKVHKKISTRKFI